MGGGDGGFPRVWALLLRRAQMGGLPRMSDATPNQRPTPDTTTKSRTLPRNKQLARGRIATHRGTEERGAPK